MLYWIIHNRSLSLFSDAMMPTVTTLVESIGAIYQELMHMAFQSGLVSFSRFRVVGADGPKACDDSILASLSKHAFKECEIGVPSDVEAGFTTGRHLFDTRFDYEKNIFGNHLLFAMRLDTHKVPAEVKHAYRQMNEQASAQASATGFASKSEKRDANDLATRQIHEDMAAGKFRKSKSIALLWNVPNGILYCGQSTSQVIEQVSKLFRDSFNVELELISAGRLAGDLIRSIGRGRDYEDLQPSPFTPPPPRAIAQHNDVDEAAKNITIPAVPWCSQSLDTKDYLGNEFMIWLWHQSEQEHGRIDCHVDTNMKPSDTADYYVTFDQSLDMDCAWGAGGKQTLRGDGPVSMPEAGEAMLTGKWPRKAGLIVADNEHQWQLTLQADRLTVSAIKLPTVEDLQSPRELIESRIMMIDSLAKSLDRLYATFLSRRIGSTWPASRSTIASWIKKRRQRPGRVRVDNEHELQAVGCEK